MRRLARGIKAGKYYDVLGCSLAELKQHLEKRFYGGMTWENYGSRWHVDHIKPCAAFDLSKPNEQRVCFHYSNLQPMLASENQSKGARYLGKLFRFRS